MSLAAAATASQVAAAAAAPSRAAAAPSRAAAAPSRPYGCTGRRLPCSSARMYDGSLRWLGFHRGGRGVIEGANERGGARSTRGPGDSSDFAVSPRTAYFGNIPSLAAPPPIR